MKGQDDKPTPEELERQVREFDAGLREFTGREFKEALSTLDPNDVEGFARLFYKRYHKAMSILANE